MELLPTVSILPSGPDTVNAGGLIIDHQPTATGGSGKSLTRDAVRVLSEDEPATGADTSDSGRTGEPGGRGQLVDITV